MDKYGNQPDFHQAINHSNYLLSCLTEFPIFLKEPHSNFLDMYGRNLNLDAKEFYFVKILKTAAESLQTTNTWSKSFSNTLRLGMSPNSDLTSAICVHLNLNRRRIFECLVKTILFRTTDTQESYRHFCLIDELMRLNASIIDKLTYFGKVGELETQIRDSVKVSIFDLESTNPALSNSWYISTAGPRRNRDQFYCGLKVFESTAGLLKKATPLLSNYEKVVVGTSYQVVFGTTSNSVHFTTSPTWINTQTDVLSIERLCENICMMCELLIIIVSKFVQDKMTPQIEILAKNIQSLSTETESLLSRSIFLDIKQGQLVSYYDILCEVNEKHISLYQLPSYRITTLSLDDNYSDWVSVSELRVVNEEDSVKIAELEKEELHSQLLQASTKEKRIEIIEKFAKTEWRAIFSPKIDRNLVNTSI